MSGTVLINAVKRRFGLPIREIGRLLMVGSRTIRRWSAPRKNNRQEVPGPAEIVLELLLRDDITVEQLDGARRRVERRWNRLGRPLPRRGRFD